MILSSSWFLPGGLFIIGLGGIPGLGAIPGLGGIPGLCGIPGLGGIPGLCCMPGRGGAPGLDPPTFLDEMVSDTTVHLGLPGPDAMLPVGRPCTAPPLPGPTPGGRDPRPPE